MYYSIELTIIAKRRLTLDALFEVPGVASGWPGKRRFETILTVWARDLPTAAAKGIARATRRVAGRAIQVNAMTIPEADRRIREMKPFVRRS